MKNTRAKNGLYVVFFAYACFTNVHTAVPNEIAQAQRKENVFSCACSCAYFTHVHI